MAPAARTTNARNEFLMTLPLEVVPVSSFPSIGRFVPAVLTALLVVGSASAQPGRRGGREEGAEYGWRSNYAAARAEAKRTGKPLMVVFRCVP